MNLTSDFQKREWKILASASLIAGLSYIFADVTLSGVVNLVSVSVYLLVYILVFAAGEFLLDE